jgi:hypothetical protein
MSEPGTPSPFPDPSTPARPGTQGKRAALVAALVLSHALAYYVGTGSAKPERAAPGAPIHYLVAFEYRVRDAQGETLAYGFGSRVKERLWSPAGPTIPQLVEMRDLIASDPTLHQDPNAKEVSAVIIGYYPIYHPPAEETKTDHNAPNK